MNHGRWGGGNSVGGAGFVGRVGVAFYHGSEQAVPEDEVGAVVSFGVVHLMMAMMRGGEDFFFPSHFAIVADPGSFEKSKSVA